VKCPLPLLCMMVAAAPSISISASCHGVSPTESMDEGETDPVHSGGDTLRGRAHVRGVLVDDYTGEAVAHQWITILGPGGLRERVRTDNEGRFATRTRFPEGRVTLSMHRHPRERIGFIPVTTGHHAPSGSLGATRFPIRFSPEYRVNVECEAEANGGKGPVLFYLKHGQSDVRTAPAVVEWDRDSAAPLVVRLKAPDVFGAAQEWATRCLWDLHAETEDGLVGSVPVATLAGLSGGELTMSVGAAASVEGKVLPGRESDFAIVALWRLGASEEWRRAGIVKVRPDERFKFDGLLPGKYILSAGHDEYMVQQEVFDLGAGQRIIRDLRVKPPDDGGVRIEGMLRSSSGEFMLEDLMLIAEPTARSGPASLSSVSWVPREREIAGRFTFDNLQEGEYTVRPFDPMYLRFSPSFIKVVPPAHNIAFEVLDDDSSSVAAVVVDAETETVIDTARFCYSFGDKKRSISGGGDRLFSSGEVVLGWLPLDCKVEWRISADGYAPAFGDESDLHANRMPTVGPRKDNVTVRLRKGWGARISAVSEAGEMVCGINVLLDDVLVGRTDSEGQLVCCSGWKPERIHIRSDQWKLSGGDVDAQTGLFFVSKDEITMIVRAR